MVGTSGCIQLSEARLSTTDPNLFVGTEYEAFERVRAACRLTRLGLARHGLCPGCNSATSIL